MLLWPREFPQRNIDTDSPTDMQWIYQKALERSQQYHIPGVTYMLTLGVVKNIIPAVASTNAIIAAACVHEAIKVISFCSQSLNTYMMYMGSTGIYSHTFVYEKKEDCPVCSTTIRRMTVSPTMSLNELLQALKEGELRLKSPSVTTGEKTLYMQRPPALEQATRPNLDRQLSSMIDSGDELIVTDPIFPGTSVALSIIFDT
jgi:ubiquitin-activating enzyme E1 C